MSISDDGAFALLRRHGLLHYDRDLVKGFTASRDLAPADYVAACREQSPSLFHAFDARTATRQEADAAFKRLTSRAPPRRTPPAGTPDAMKMSAAEYEIARKAITRPVPRNFHHNGAR